MPTCDTGNTALHCTLHTALHCTHCNTLHYTVLYRTAPTVGVAVALCLGERRVITLQPQQWAWCVGQHTARPHSMMKVRSYKQVAGARGGDAWEHEQHSRK